MQTITLNIEGMTCGGCVKSVTRILENTQGVAKAEVSLDNKNAIIEFDPAKRRDYAIQIQQLLMNDGAALFLGYPKTNIVTGSYLKGAVMYPSDYYWITNKITK